VAQAEAFLPEGQTSGAPALIVARNRVRRGSRSADRPHGDSDVPAGDFSDDVEFYEVISRDAGQSWTELPTAGPGWPGCLALSPDFGRDRTLFGCIPGVGVVRSSDRGRSWRPAHAGITGAEVIDIVLSPQFGTDHTLFATTFLGIQAEDQVPTPEYRRTPPPTPDRSGLPPTLWRSQDAGASWQPIGRFAAAAVSPDYRTDRTVMAFGYLEPRFYVSTDGGDHWQARGRLPELGYAESVGTRLWMLFPPHQAGPLLVALANSGTGLGGGPHWPESGARVFRSSDQGRTWDLTWEPDDEAEKPPAWDGVLMGPIANGQPMDFPDWILTVGPTALMVKSNGRLHNEIVQADAYPIAVWPDGSVLVAEVPFGALRTVVFDTWGHTSDSPDYTGRFGSEQHMSYPGP
jgi:hypothetical protein